MATGSQVSPDKINLPTGTTAERPSSPSIGGARFNTTLGVVEYWDGSIWVGIGLADGSSYSSAAESAVAIKALTGTTVDGFYWININGVPTQVWCDMNNNGGGWMLVAKASGVDDSQWTYDDAYWTNSTLVNETGDALTFNGHIKTKVYTSVPFSQVRIAMNSLSNGIVESGWSNSTSFASFMTYGSSSSNARSVWTTWVDNAFGVSGSAWLANCNQFGTSKAYNYQYIKLGGTINGENDCSSNDEAFGFGVKGISPYGNNLSCGAYSPYGKPSGRKVGWIFVK